MTTSLWKFDISWPSGLKIKTGTVKHYCAFPGSWCIDALCSSHMDLSCGPLLTQEMHSLQVKDFLQGSRKLPQRRGIIILSGFIHKWKLNDSSALFFVSQNPNNLLNIKKTRSKSMFITVVYHRLNVNKYFFSQYIYIL